MPTSDQVIVLPSRFIKLVFAFIFLSTLSACANLTPPKTSNIDSLQSSDGDLAVLLMPLDVELSVLTAGGALEPRADWTEMARDHMTSSIKGYQESNGADLILFNDDKDNSVEIAELEALHSVVGNSIFLHHYFPMHHLPSKQGALDWSLGSTVSAFKDEYDADYALFVLVRDSYSSPGRVAAMIVGAALGVGVGGGFQVGFASLVDLRTGKVVWFNRLLNGSGDIRTAATAEHTVKLLLAGMPR